MNIEQPSNYYIGYTCNLEDRFNASSGGIGTAVTRYLLSENFGTAVSFIFNKEKKMYEPILIHEPEDVNVCGSIYQDIDITGFIKDNIDQIKGGIIVSCPPCQVSAIRSILNKHKISSFVISFCCSGQTSVEGTWKYYEFLGIKKDDVIDMQYRGKGWPSGIQIKLKNGGTILHRNWTEPWITIHQSNLFRPKRCFYCILDCSYKSDLSLADPWLKEYIENDKEGHTLFFSNTKLGESIVEKMRELKLIQFKETDYNSYYMAQQPNIEKKNRLRNQRREIEIDIKLTKKTIIRCFFTKNQTRMRLFIRIRNYILRLSANKGRMGLFTNIINRLKSWLRFCIIAPKLGSYNGRFNLRGGVELNNPKHIHFGKGVGIGENAFFLPVVSDNGHKYNPSIIVGDGTWIGKGCSIAAINKVEIGKHVLFAGQVHITDHSHGYEDISLPISPQPLITKGPITIDDDCWLGFGCEILSGVHIGKHSIVAARSVVTKDVPAYTIVAGNPARIVKQYNFETKKWEKLQKST